MRANLSKYWSFYCWLLGLVLFFIGEGVAAFDRWKGNTASEKFACLPQPAKYAVVGGMFAVIAHWVWPLPSIDIDIDVEVNQSK